MYCPKCGTQNTDDASFCRGCGANVSLVPQALAGHLPAPVAAGKDVQPGQHKRDEHKRVEPPNLTYAIVKTFVGIAFVLVALSVRNVNQIAGHIWWFWMLIPAAGSLGSGVAEFARLYQQQTTTPQLPAANAYVPPAVSPSPRAAELPPRVTTDFYTPSSVTENTTKLLEKDQ
ncbi:MAG TPA: zinc ribbon domain-containing protein [Pyrinomonadaceae bacterium]|nr:zinc ribbon domain-containing protein [Pyrinomonadaceae bacterium]